MTHPAKSISVSHIMIENRKYPPQQLFKASSHINSIEIYEKMYKESIEDSDRFWLEQANQLDWFSKRLSPENMFGTVLNVRFSTLGLKTAN